MQVLDLLGQEIQPGDRVAGAFRTGNTAEMRVGTVLGFSERDNDLTVTVEWDISSNYIQYPGRNVHNPPEVPNGTIHGGIKGNIQANRLRFVKIGA